MALERLRTERMDFIKVCIFSVVREIGLSLAGRPHDSTAPPLREQKENKKRSSPGQRGERGGTRENKEGMSTIYIDNRDRPVPCHAIGLIHGRCGRHHQALGVAEQNKNITQFVVNHARSIASRYAKGD